MLVRKNRNPLLNYLTPGEQRGLLVLCVFILLGCGLNVTGWAPLPAAPKQNATNSAGLAEKVSRDHVVLIDIRTAAIEELIKLPGIGAKRAQDIINRRNTEPFRSTSDLLSIKGIGEKTYLKMRPYLVLFGADTLAVAGAVGTDSIKADKPVTTRASSKPKADNTAPVNINTAGLEELMTLKGIGKVKANAIIEYREANGAFQSVDDLVKVKGIGPKTLENNRPRLRI
ncbi:MAG: helix-hairpin-helix domain-containing protein [Candidatus Cloacimonetes bacterium]|nr:helix-hairpin-helix domain-containing protein [Candidatus Cloacimonadota bacterium]